MSTNHHPEGGSGGHASRLPAPRARSKFGGGYRHPASFVEKAKRMVDDMNRWWHDAGTSEPAVGQAIGGVHFYDAMVFIEKNTALARPAHSQLGKGQPRVAA